MQQGQFVVHFLKETTPYKRWLFHGKAQVLSYSGGFKGQHGQTNIVNKEEAVQEKLALSNEEFKVFNWEEAERLRKLLENLNKSSS